MKQKIRDFTAILIIQLIFTLPFYTVNAHSLTISNVRVAKVSSNSATIEWETDNISNGRVRYGKTAGLGFTQRHDNFIGNHSVALFNGIDSDTNYFFAVESTDLAGSSAIDNNSNSFYTFRTSDITPPPQVAGLRLVSATSSSISITWNSINISDFSHYIIYKDRAPIGNSTSSTFNDTSLGTSKEHNYKISAVDISGNEGPQSDTLIASASEIDSIAPVISNLDVLGITDTTARVTWLTNEPATTIAIYGMNKTDKVKSSNELELNHTIVIDGLAKNNQIMFVAKSCDASNNCANLSQNFTAGKDTKLPFINLSIPRFFNRKFMDIIGSTEPFSSVTLFVNNMNVPRRSLSNNEVGMSGKFAFSQIQMEQNNVIKIVMVDKSGNKNQKIFETSLDMQDPIVQLNEIPQIISKANLSISGSTDEPAIIKVFVETSINESSAPSKIMGLNATKIGPNSVGMRWDESKDKDFSHYAVYREDIGPIAITKPANFNLYIDALVDSGKSYTYRVSAVSIFGKEGPKSDPLTVSTLKNGQVLNLKPPEIDALEDFRKPLMIVNVSSPFSFDVKLSKGDGTYFVKLIFEDRAENSVIFERKVTLDTKKPQVKILSPPSGSFIFENVANEVDIVGTTKPNARVHLFVDRTPFSFFNNSFEISGLPNEIQNLPEAQLDAKCRSSVSTSFCRTGADFSVDADSEGNFRFENVDMTVIFGGAARLTEVPPQDFRDTVLNQEAQESKRVVLVVIATDQTGQRGAATQTVRIGTCWSGNQSWEVIPLNQHQYPTFLSTERFAEGIETIYFYFNYTYLGRGTNARITGISLSKACGTKELLDPRFNISCQVLPSGDTPTKLGSSKTISYSAITLSRFPGMDKFLEDDWKGFLKAINKELTFPFKVRIAYEHDVINGEGKSVPVRETQTLCEQVTYVVDDAIIDPRKVLPDWLLFDFVDFLKESVDTITELQQKIDTLINYVAIGCLGSIFANGVIKIWRNWMELWDEKLFALKEIAFSLDTEQKSQECKDLTKAVKDAYGSLKLKYFSDADLKKCFPGSASAWETEAKVYKLQRWTCDRIFGHSSPAGWTKDVGDEELHRTITTEKTCNSDASVRGQRIKVEYCKDLPKNYIDIIKDPAHIPFDLKCFLINFDAKEPAKKFVYRFDPEQPADLTANKIYRLIPYQTTAPKAEVYVLKTQSDNFYLTSQPQTCAELCGIKSQQQNTGIQSIGSNDIVEETVYDKDKKDFVTLKDYNEKQALLKKETPEQAAKRNIRISSCVTVNQCREWHARSGSKADGILYKGVQIKDYRVESKGYASNCFYGSTIGGPEIVSDTDPNTRKECCCINGQGSQFKTVYYQPDDVDAKLEEKLPRGQQVHKSKKAVDVPVAGQITQEAAPLGQYDYGDMEFSYRYSRIGYLGKKYNPNRYISGRDQSACLGQDEPFSLIAGRKTEVAMLEPARQDTVVLWPCLYLTGVNQRLQRIKVIANAMSNCLIQVRTSGRADTGVCKELFTQHLCGAIWQGIRFFVDGCTPDYLGPGNQDEKEGKWLEDAQLGMKGIFQGIAESQSEIAQDYSNAKLNDFLGAGEESVARKVCLAAFGYDWEINAKNLIDAAYSAPFASLVQAVTRSREFLTVDPVTKRPKYEYRSSWIINPGCDLERYDVQLACVTKKELDKYPNQISCGSVGSGSVGYTGRAGEISSGYNQCDCLELGQEQAESFASGSRIKQNSLEDKSLSRVIESQRRFDHVKITLRPDRRIGPGSRTGFDARTNCFPQGFEEGVFYFPIIDKTARDILDCTVDASTGIFNCGSGTDFFSRQGIAEVIEVRISQGTENNKRAEDFKEAEVGKPLDIILKIRKTGLDKCARMTLSDLSPQNEFIRENATTEVRFTTPSLTIAGREKDVDAPTGVVVRLLEQQNSIPVEINVQFQGNMPQPDQKAADTTFSLSDDNDMIFVEGISDKLMPTTEFRKLLEERNTPNEIIVEKNGAKIKIDNSVTTMEPPRLAGQPYTRGGRITINPQRQTTQLQGSQQKKVIIEIFNVKENDPNDCNVGDPLFKKDYSFVVSAKAINIDRPAIDPPEFWVNNKKTGNIVKKGNFVTIKARVVDGFQVQNIDLTLTAPDGSSVGEAQGLQRFDPQGDFYIFKFDTNKAPSAGVYKGTIRAKSKKAERLENSIQFTLEIQCGDDSNGYGKCQDAVCPTGKSITGGFKCKKESVEDIGIDGNPIATEVNQPCCRIQ